MVNTEENKQKNVSQLAAVLGGELVILSDLNEGADELVRYDPLVCTALGASTFASGVIKSSAPQSADLSTAVPSASNQIGAPRGEEIKRITPYPDSSPPFSTFPSRGLARFRERLAAKLSNYEDDPASFTQFRLDYASSKLTEEILSGALAHRVPLPFSPCLSPCVDPPSLDDPHGVLDDFTEMGSLSQTKENACCRHAENRRKAKKIVKLLRVDQSLEPVVKQVPKVIPCGSLRRVIRSLYAPELNPAQELSIKTSAKAGGQPCEFCLDLMTNSYLSRYKRERLSPASVSDEHLELFGRVLSSNIPEGWNTRKVPYIPNGNATSGHSRKDGGNWNTDAFSPDCKTALIFSSGKPRVVTLFSAFNVEVLTPLHRSLYSFLKGRNWLLVGSPTHERLRHLRDGCQGDQWFSFDYESATDNIKTQYVSRAVDILVQKGVGLTDDEIRCMRVLSSLSLDGNLAETGQPMGSPLSFPLLCLINKTVVDLALLQLLSEGSISFKEWSSHRLLVNGDDLLTRSTSSGDLVSAISSHGLQVGLKVNTEKTMVSSVWAEINSTAFYDSGLIKEIKKTNVSALWMAFDVQDVLGFAQEATVRKRGFLKVALNNVSRLARQKRKTYGWLDCANWNAVVSNKKLRIAVASAPTSEVQDPRNLFPTVIVPDNYDLSREEENEVITAQVIRARDRGLWKPLFSDKLRLKKARKSVRSELRGSASRRETERRIRLREKPMTEDKRGLSCLVSHWRKKKMNENFLAEEGASVPYASDYTVFDGESCSPWVQIRHILKEKVQRKNRATHPPGSSSLGIPDPFSDGDGYVAFAM